MEQKSFLTSVTLWAVLANLAVKGLQAAGFLATGADLEQYQKLILEFGPIIVGAVIDLIAGWGRLRAKTVLVAKVPPKEPEPTETGAQ